ncbi:MAG: PAS domain S-box protein [Chitinivorax sp.]
MITVSALRTHLKHLFSRPATAWVVLAITLALTLLLCQMVQHASRQRAQENFLYQAKQQQQIIVERLNDYLQQLRGGVGLFNASQDVSRDEWRLYIQSLGLAETLPGAQAIGFARHVTAQDKTEFEQARRAEGFGDFRIWPAGAREHYFSVDYVEPLSAINRKALGYDGYSEPIRRAAMQRAAASGEVAMSGRIGLVQDARPQQAGVIVYLPVYRQRQPLATAQQRQQALYGFVYGAFRISNLMTGMLGDTPPEVDIRLYDQRVTAANLLYSPDSASIAPRFSTDLPIDFAGHRWIARISSRPGQEQANVGGMPPGLVLAIGLTFNLLLFAVLLGHIHHRREQEQIACELRASRDRFSALVENVPGVVFRTNCAPPWQWEFISRPIESTSGEPAERFLSGELRYIDMVHPDDRQTTEDAIAHAIATHTSYEAEFRITDRQGRQRWVNARGVPRYDAQGNPLCIDGMLLDVTARRQAEQELRTLTDALPVAVYRYRRERDGTPNLLYVSQQVERLFGISARDAMADPVRLFGHIHPDDLPGFLEADRVASETLTDFSREIRVLFGAGGERWLYLNSSPQPMADGKIAYVGFVEDITERKQADCLLQESEDRYRRIVETASEGIWTMDAEHRTTFVNQAMTQMLGYSNAEMLGRRIDEFMFDDDLRNHAEQLGTGQQGIDQRYERRFRRKDGSECWCLISATSLHDEHGQFAGSFAMFSEITAIKHTEEQLAARESLLQQIFDTSSVAIFLVDKQGIITHANRRMAEMFHCRQEQLIGTPYIAHVHPKERALSQQRMQALLDSDIGNVDLERRFWREDGSEFWGNLTGRRFYDVHGNEHGLLGVIADITERHLAEEELRIAATTFQIQDGIMVTDAAGVILRVNPAFTETTGYSAAEAIGRDPSLLRSSRNDANFFHHMWAELLQHGKWQGELWNRRKNGEEYPEWLTITAVKDRTGQVTHYVGAFHDITERKAAEEEIRSLAFYDPLTRLPNRRLLMDRLQQGLATTARSGNHGALIFIDLDNFKTLNDTLGHDIGDQLLVAVARRLQAGVREGDTVARLGGDEFIVMLAGLHESTSEAAAQVEVIGNKIISELNPPYQLGKHELRSTPSLGIALFRGHDTGVEELLKRADMAMYQAKAAGRNTLRFFDPAMQASINARAIMESEMYRAIEEREFVLHYQPQVDHTGHCIGVEALLRWHSPKRGMVSPAEFIPLAEETGQILPIGHWVLLQACLQQVAWQADPATERLVIAVNVSAKQFRLPVFVDELRNLIRHTGANPARLKLELTESMLLGDMDDAIVKMGALQGLGVSFALDDFGTGYSSLAYLKQLPLDQMKIDRSFVRDILTDPNDAAICRAVIALGKSLGLHVIAEGVETASQWRFLRDEGCDEAQGYLFARPLPLAELQQWLQRNTPAAQTVP